MRSLITPLSISLCLGASVTAFAGNPTGFPSALPPVSNPGECYAQVKIPAQYTQGSQQVVTAEGYAKLDVTQAQFERREETVLTKEPSVRYVVRQPQYRSVTDRVLTRPGHDRLSVAPPQFSTVTEKLQTSAPHLVWKRGNPGDLRRQGYTIHSTADGRLRSSSGYQGGSYANTQSGGDSCGPGCEIWCLVEEPATSVTTSRRVMSTPSRVIRTPVAPQYRSITKQVLSEAGGVEEIPIPAEYQTVTVEDLVRPAEAYETNVPAQYGNVSTKDLISPERYEWRRVVCRPGSGGGSVAGALSGSTPSSYSTSSHSSTTHSGATYGTTTHGGASHSGSTYSGSSHGSATTYGTSTPEWRDVTPDHSSSSRTRHYGTEDYPAYRQRRGPSRIRR